MSLAQLEPIDLPDKALSYPEAIAEQIPDDGW